MTLVYHEDAFGLRRQPDPFVVNTRWAFETDPRKLQNFNAWFKQQVDEGILELQAGADPENPWTSRYVNSAYRQGTIRAYNDAKQAGAAQAIPSTQAEFLQLAFNQPVNVERLRMLNIRAFDQLKGVSTQMGQDMSRVLSDGFARGDGARKVARELANTVDIGKRRALRVARTETVHAYAEAQLDAFETLGVEELGIMAEWSTTQDDRVCAMCAPLEGVVMTVKEARGLLPRHPNCRCAWIPANVGEKKPKGQKRSKTEADKAIKQSVRAEHPKSKQPIADSRWLGANRPLSAAARRRAKKAADETQGLQVSDTARSQPRPAPTPPKPKFGGALDLNRFRSVETNEFDDRILAGVVRNAKAQHRTAKNVGRAWVKGEAPPKGISRPATERHERVYAALERRYADTQKALRAADVEDIEVFRGLDVPADTQLAKDVASGKLKVGDKFTVQGDNIQSYSTSRDIADQFAETPIPTIDDAGEFASARIDEESIGITVRRRVPRNEVVATPESTPGYALQKEVIAVESGGTEYEILEVYDLDNVRI